jgi:di/tricarboxylate transporter
MLSAAVLILLAGVLAPDEAYRAVEWRAIFLIAGMYAVSVAMVQTGLAALIGTQVLGAVQGFGPLGLAAGSYLLTAGLTQLIGGQVAALITGPIVLSAAVSMHTSPQAMAVAAAIGCSASFLTPIAHPVNILMLRPGRYRFADFFRIGWGLTVVVLVTLLAGMVWFWRL